MEIQGRAHAWINERKTHDDDVIGIVGISLNSRTAFLWVNLIATHKQPHRAALVLHFKYY